MALPGRIETETAGGLVRAWPFENEPTAHFNPKESFRCRPAAGAAGRRSATRADTTDPRARIRTLQRRFRTDATKKAPAGLRAASSLHSRPLVPVGVNRARRSLDDRDRDCERCAHPGWGFQWGAQQPACA